MSLLSNLNLGYKLSKISKKALVLLGGAVVIVASGSIYYIKSKTLSTKEHAGVASCITLCRQQQETYNRLCLQYNKPSNKKIYDGDHDKTLKIKVGDQIKLSVTYNPTTGYQAFSPIYDKNVFKLIKTDKQSNNLPPRRILPPQHIQESNNITNRSNYRQEPIVGNSSRKITYYFEAIKPARTTTIKVGIYRPWQPNKKIIQHTLNVQVYGNIIYQKPRISKPITRINKPHISQPAIQSNNKPHISQPAIRNNNNYLNSKSKKPIQNKPLGTPIIANKIVRPLPPICQKPFNFNACVTQCQQKYNQKPGTCKTDKDCYGMGCANATNRNVTPKCINNRCVCLNQKPRITKPPIGNINRKCTPYEAVKCANSCKTQNKQMSSCLVIKGNVECACQSNKPSPTPLHSPTPKITTQCSAPNCKAEYSCVQQGTQIKNSSNQTMICDPNGSGNWLIIQNNLPTPTETPIITSKPLITTKPPIYITKPIQQTPMPPTYNNRGSNQQSSYNSKPIQQTPIPPTNNRDGENNNNNFDIQPYEQGNLVNKGHNPNNGRIIYKEPPQPTQTPEPQNNYYEPHQNIIDKIITSITRFFRLW